MQARAFKAKPARLAAIAAGLALVVLLGARPALDPGAPSARAVGPLPACRYDDILTTPRRYSDWAITLVDTILRIPKTYAPPDLVRVADLGVPGRGKVRAVIADDLKAMSDAAAAAGNPIGIESAYRSYEDQQQVFQSWVARLGRAEALQVSARPGHSEHQLGITLDVRSDPPDETLQGSWGLTPAGKWMKAHAWEYGFVMSYPKGRSDLTCYAYEPWHFRYVGHDLAAAIHASGLTPREYLWANFTTTVVPPPPPSPTKKPASTSSPVASPTSTPDLSLPPLETPTVDASPTAAPSVVATPTTLPATAGPTAPPAPSAPPDVGPPVALTSGPVLLAGAGLLLGTIVLGGAWLSRRRGRSGVGL